MRISDWSSDVCSSDLDAIEDVHYLEAHQDTLQWQRDQADVRGGAEQALLDAQRATFALDAKARREDLDALELRAPNDGVLMLAANWSGVKPATGARSEEHTSELQSLMRISYAVFCLKKKK